NNAWRFAFARAPEPVSDMWVPTAPLPGVIASWRRSVLAQRGAFTRICAIPCVQYKFAKPKIGAYEPIRTQREPASVTFTAKLSPTRWLADVIPAQRSPIGL